MAKGQDTQPMQAVNNSSTSGSSSTAQNILTPEQQQLMGLVMPGVQQFNAFVPQRYQGPTIANFDPSQTRGQNLALDAAGAQGGLAKSAADTANYWMSGNVWDPANNTGLTGAIDAATRPIGQMLTETALPALRGEAVTTGNFGSSRQGIAEGLASGRASQAVGDTAAKITQAEYETNVNAQLRAMGMLPQVQQAQLAPAVTTSGVGDVRQAMAQAQLGEGVQNFQLDQMLQIAPFLKSQEILAMLQGLPGGGTTTSGTGFGTTSGMAQANNPPKAPGWQQALGGAATGAGIGGAVGGPWGAGIGAAGGAVLPFLFA